MFRRLLPALCIALAVSLGLTALRGCAPMRGLEREAIDLRTRWIPRARAGEAPITIVQIEDADVEALKASAHLTWPWPLEVNQLLVDCIHRAGAKAIAVDILHLDRGAGVDDVRDPDALDEASRERLTFGVEAARGYADALEASERAVLAAKLDRADAGMSATRLAASRSHEALVTGHAPDEAPRREHILVPVSVLGRAARAVGLVNVWPDPDGVVRRVHVAGRAGTWTVPSLALAAAAQAAHPASTRFEDRAVVVGETSQALHDDASFYWAVPEGGARVHPRVAARDVLAWAQAPELPQAARDALSGRIVVLGVNLAGHEDVVATPFGSMDGPQLQAWAIDNLWTSSGRVRASWHHELLLLLGAAFVVACLMALRKGGLWGAASLAGGALLTAAFVVWRFRAGQVFDLWLPLAAALFTGLGFQSWRAWRQAQYSRWLEGTFGRYLSPSVIAALKRDPSLVHLVRARARGDSALQ